MHNNACSGNERPEPDVSLRLSVGTRLIPHPAKVLLYIPFFPNFTMLMTMTITLMTWLFSRLTKVGRMLFSSAHKSLVELLLLLMVFLGLYSNLFFILSTAVPVSTISQKQFNNFYKLFFSMQLGWTKCGSFTILSGTDGPCFILFGRWRGR